jgi:nicotinamidase-related amidase
VAEGASAAADIVDLITKASAAKALIVATRDYHPKNHCSFNTNKGPFPPHCIQGSEGSKLFYVIEQALTKAKEQGADVRIVFKGFCPSADSFGACTYGQKYYTERTLGNEAGATVPTQQVAGCSAIEWTGSFSLECSNCDVDLNAPPDVMAVFGRKTLAQEIKDFKGKRMFVTGLAMDFCCLDTALNAATAKVVPDGIYMPVEANRAAHIPGIGTFGSGFLTDPADLVKKTKLAGVKLIHVDTIQG